jgi:hypothetical protein
VARTELVRRGNDEAGWSIPSGQREQAGFLGGLMESLGLDAQGTLGGWAGMGREPGMPNTPRRGSIDASAQRVWEVLTNLGTIRGGTVHLEVHGDVRVGAEIRFGSSSCGMRIWTDARVLRFESDRAVLEAHFVGDGSSAGALVFHHPLARAESVPSPGDFGGIGLLVLQAILRKHGRRFTRAQPRLKERVENIGDQRVLCSLSPVHRRAAPQYVVVAGSGYGGSMAAATARAGRSVCLLERGQERLPGSRRRRPPACSRTSVRYSAGTWRLGGGALRLPYNDDISVVVGCLGGVAHQRRYLSSARSSVFAANGGPSNARRFPLEASSRRPSGC